LERGIHGQTDEGTKRSFSDSKVTYNRTAWALLGLSCSE